MPRRTLLRLHRWIALAFALPLAAVTLSGLVLVAEPALKAATPAGTVTVQRLDAVLAAAGGRPQAIAVRGYDGTASLGGRGQPAAVFDLATAERTTPGPLPAVFLTARRLHETLLLDLGWLVAASTAAMVLLAPLGLLLGWPKLRNTVMGWHRLGGWAALPLVVGSPLTGLFLALGLSFAPAAPPVPAGAPVPLPQAIRMVAERHPLDGLDWIRPMGGGLAARVLDEGGTARVYRVTQEGLVRMPTPWVRVLHEGNWGGLLGSAANLVAAVVLSGLLGTGVWLWARREAMKRRARRRALAAA